MRTEQKVLVARVAIWVLHLVFFLMFSNLGVSKQDSPTQETAISFLGFGGIQLAATALLVVAVMRPRVRTIKWVIPALTAWYYFGAFFGAALAGAFAGSGYPWLLACGMLVGAATLATTGDLSLRALDERPTGATDIAVFLVGTHVLVLLVIGAAVSAVFGPPGEVSNNLLYDGALALTVLAIPLCAGILIRLHLTPRNGRFTAAVEARGVDGTSLPRLASLAPSYQEEQHGVYADVLERALIDTPSVHNIALSGPYGTGKSSILSRVAARFPDRVLQISLLTLGAAPEPGAEDGDRRSISNQIQKEIVKQLLYQRRPTHAPQSRFHRIVRFSWFDELLVSGGVAVVAFSVPLLLGVQVSFEPTFSLTFAREYDITAEWIMYSVIAVIAGLIALVLRAAIRGRIGIEKVTAGPATITLPARSSSYFDEYLDEIIYLFESDRNRDIVIVEDLDRFNSHSIYEALRSLNGLLNAAQQLENRDVRFIYAVRDSVFENVGQNSNGDPETSELLRSNRTKFFDLIVPVVPFITHKNARDLMVTELSDRELEIDPDLIDLAARHLADMRLIRNAVNEYSIFKNRLLDAKTPVPGLDAERLFALILFKNAHPEQFERIRHGDSVLDDLWESHRELVESALDKLRTENGRLRTEIERSDQSRQYARTLGDDLIARTEVLSAAFTATHLRHNGATVSEDELRSREFWKTFASTDKPLLLRTIDRYGRTHDVPLTPSVVETLLGRTIDIERVQTSATEAMQTRIDAITDARRRLPRTTWAELAVSNYRHTFTEGQDPLTFTEVVRATLPSELAADLVIHGFINSYFNLFISTFYDTVVGPGPDAKIYILRFIDKRRADASYPLTGPDVEAILKDQGVSVLRERSMFNVNILDHLLANRRDDAETVVQQALAAGDEGKAFLEQYLESGAHKHLLVRVLAPLFDNVLGLLVATPSLDPVERVQLIDAVVQDAGPELKLTIPQSIAEVLEAHPEAIESLRSANSVDEAHVVIAFLEASGAVLPDITDASAGAVEALRVTRTYRLNARNLRHLIGRDDVSLDALRGTAQEMFGYAVAHPRFFIAALDETGDNTVSVTSSDVLTDYLRAADDEDLEAVKQIIRRADTAAEAHSIAKISPDLWSILFAQERVPMAFRNVKAYVAKRGGVDDLLAKALVRVGRIDDFKGFEQAARTRVAVAILNSPSSVLDEQRRIELAAQIEPAVIGAAQLVPLPGVFIGDLLKAGLLADDADVFSSALMADWKTQSHAIRHSAYFPGNVGPDTLAPQFVAPLLKDVEHRGLRPTVASTMEQYETLPREAWTAYAELALGDRPPFAATGSAVRNAVRDGLDQDTGLQLLAMENTAMALDDVRATLRALGEPWKTLADPGYSSRLVVVTPSSAEVLRRLKAGGIVSNFVPKDGKYKVTLRRP